MSLDLPNHGDADWDIKLNAALEQLDEQDTDEATARIAGDAASVTTAATDATTKANAAQAAAIAAAASDATTKANAAQAAAIQRANHTGSQAISTVTGLQTALDGKADDTAVVKLTGTQTVAGAKTFSSALAVPDDAYNATSWNGSVEVPTKNAVRDKFESLTAGAPLDYPGTYLTVGNYATGYANVVVSNCAWYLRCYGAGTITAIRVRIGTASGNVCVGAYAASGTAVSRVPAGRSGTSGSVACPAAGDALINLGGSTVVAVGDYLAVSADNTTATFLGESTSNVSTLMGRGILHFQTASAFPLPATAAPAGTQVGRLFYMQGE